MRQHASVLGAQRKKLELLRLTHVLRQQVKVVQLAPRQGYLVTRSHHKMLKMYGNLKKKRSWHVEMPTGCKVAIVQKRMRLNDMFQKSFGSPQRFLGRRRTYVPSPTENAKVHREPKNDQVHPICAQSDTSQLPDQTSDNQRI